MPSVLIVDDEPSIRQLIATLFTLEGFDVSTAPDGQAALEQIHAVAPDIVISDVRMPRMNGYELLTTLRADPVLRSIRFILLASYTDGNVGADSAVALADACMSKPFTRELLLKTVRTLIA
jgi:CheY-like chemotaxis protein